jgi:hypothetical protein
VWPAPLNALEVLEIASIHSEDVVELVKVGLMNLGRNETWPKSM